MHSSECLDLDLTSCNILNRVCFSLSSIFLRVWIITDNKTTIVHVYKITNVNLNMFNYVCFHYNPSHEKFSFACEKSPLGHMDIYFKFRAIDAHPPSPNQDHGWWGENEETQRPCTITYILQTGGIASPLDSTSSPASSHTGISTLPLT